MEKLTLYAILIASFHFIVVGIHGFAHQIIPVPISMLQSLFIISIITITPVVAIVLLRRESFYTGMALLFGSMLGASIFGIYNHFIVISPDHISQIPATNWGKVFQITAFLLMISEILGVGISLWGLITKEKRERI
ncbi:MAG: hypothetical protein HC836_37610 [Richelia sp. RM2_1_2]|nr:hypothetical protein [Richelia sp. SM2_1_7]NJM22404.1 hypothetical protein [Richelia sp. SM1_7_0]NJN12421.1 hypothetical protein [Richelia sp. RM1_1_1]NJO30154.1 hypothetical protein [Richelia sp. SL_2_1]NJO63704.1 hypothetical protein [Richelia sp. RM2_1_2]